jgi:hypothetical protein
MALCSACGGCDNYSTDARCRDCAGERDTVDRPPKEKKEKGGRGNGSAEVEAPG